MLSLDRRYGPLRHLAIFNDIASYMRVNLWESVTVLIIKLKRIVKSFMQCR